ncbi:hypothetical protein [Campylobacter sp. MIT 19-121]|uniref:hypothetical protein n=2 Tax=unclassified Campylobacter TaxID=2593542 RepID=UPI00192EBF5E|nr:hypothetical protein [Campylobacter sp. MIT 19-121]
MKKLFFFCLVLVFANLTFADDFLARISKGNLSDYSVGVKKLSLEEMKEVKGGAFQSVGNCFTSSNFCLSFAVSQTITGTHYKDFKAVITNEEPYYTNKHIGFIVQNNWAISGQGKRYNYFTYAAVVLDRSTGRMWKESNSVLNNNGIVRELSYRYKNTFDNQLGGLRIK